MAFNRPTLTELATRITADFVSRLNLVTPILRRALVYIMAKVWAGVAHLIYGNLAWLARQLFPDTSDADFLIRQASLYGLSLSAATFAQGNVVATGANGTLIPAGTIMQRSDGTQYVTDADGTIASGSATIAVTCATAGEIGNTDAAILLTLVSPINNVSSTLTVDVAGLAGGVDAESTDELRARLGERMKEPPLGGSNDDYKRWTRELYGSNTRVWVYPLELGAGTVTVRFMLAGSNTVPDAGQVAALQAYINARRPVTADVHVLAPVAVPLAFTIDLTPDTASTRAAVQAELEDMLARDAAPGGTILLSHIREAVSIAAGETDNIVSVPAANVVSGTGQISTMGVITWV